MKNRNISIECWINVKIPFFHSKLFTKLHYYDFYPNWNNLTLFCSFLFSLAILCCRLVLWSADENLPCWLLGCYRLLFTKHKKQLIFNSVGSSQLGSRNRFLRRSLHAYIHKVAPFLVANVIFNRQSPKYTYLKLTFEVKKKIAKNGLPESYSCGVSLCDMCVGVIMCTRIQHHSF